MYDYTTQLNISEYPYIVLGQHSLWRVHSIHNPLGYLRELYKKKSDGTPVYDNLTYLSADWKRLGSTGILPPYGIGYEPIWISPKDVNDLGMKNGQLVKITSAQTRKSVIASIYETPRCMPGVMVLEEGAWFDPVYLKDGTMVDRGGCSSTLISEMPSRNDRGPGMMICQIKIEPFDEADYA
jgi:anaerobic dimethyl sulfoxide reductase subunit A